MSNENRLTRRKFVKGMGLAATIPWLPQSIYAELRDNSSNIDSAHNILSCNIRVALPDDEKSGFGWNKRKDVCIDIIRSHNPDIICLQEVLKNQNEDLKEAFPNFFSFGFEGPEMDAHKEGYHGIAKNPIFFSKKRYELLSAGEYWLSQTPLIGESKSWGTARARHANWVRLLDKKSSVDFRVVNLHLDHKSQPAREHQIRLVIEENAQYDSQYPQILTGDFNVDASNPVYDLIKNAGWTDTYTSIHGESEPGYTAHGFEGENYSGKGKGKIDFIFVKGKSKPIFAKIIKDNDQGYYPSDHYFVSAEIDLSQ